jgi:multisubunit Na+/H+ antiporter MnhG subunit
MPAVAWATVIISALIIAVAAIGLLRVIGHLHAVHSTLGALIGGLGVVAQQTSTVPTRLVSVNTHLKPVRDFCEGI